MNYNPNTWKLEKWGLRYEDCPWLDSKFKANFMCDRVSKFPDRRMREEREVGPSGI